MVPLYMTQDNEMAVEDFTKSLRCVRQTNQDLPDERMPTTLIFLWTSLFPTSIFRC
jgi:hypothetical protein